MKKSKAPGVVGRPREFDPDEALNVAMRLFWRQGYEGTSLTDLTEAMGINRPSLYAAFGNKEELFRKALARYGQCRSFVLNAVREAPTARAAAEIVLRGTVENSDPETPGCMAVQSILACSPEAQSLRDEACSLRNQLEIVLRERFERAQAEGELSPELDPAGLARYLAVLTQGMAIQATAGATREDLFRVVEIAMRSWPS